MKLQIGLERDNPAIVRDTDLGVVMPADFAYPEPDVSVWMPQTLLTPEAHGADVVTVNPAVTAMGGYALAKYDFTGRRGVLASVLGATAVPGTALAVPT